MLVKYFLFGFLLDAQICWSYLVLPFATNRVSLQTPSDAQNVGKPLILTPHLKSKRIAYARELSNVEPFLKGIVSNSGFFTVNETYNSNIFFWFFRKEGKDWDSAPLVLWLQGGPGCSSLYGLFEENGPFFVTKRGLKRRKYSWTKDFNVLYIDQPIGSGFSFTNSSSGYISTQEQVADHLYEALSQFFQLYPELKNNNFYISGESYAGRYIPAIAFKIHRLKMAGKSNINLKGLFMISATIDGIALNNDMAEFCFQIGIIDRRIKEELKTMERDTESHIHSRLWKNASRLMDDILFKIYNQSSVSFHDYTKSPSSFEDQYIQFLESPDTRKKIHVGNVTYYECSDKVYDDFDEDIPKTVVPWVEELIEHYPIAFIGGQFDIIVAYPLVINAIKQLHWSGAFEYSKANRSIIYDGKRVAGYSKSTGNLKEVLVRLAGHMVPQSQPRVALNLLNRFVNDKL
ncbi:hypothetical protein V9T40_011606 [Parthenolecanium corni]|uniref:Carboxypeptidase n=1 Tax=Parthenolecanium corni TaxID=536013 RepID=A0AAN9T848_9HEMI